MPEPDRYRQVDTGPVQIHYGTLRLQAKLQHGSTQNWWCIRSKTRHSEPSVYIMTYTVNIEIGQWHLWCLAFPDAWLDHNKNCLHMAFTCCVCSEDLCGHKCGYQTGHYPDSQDPIGPRWAPCSPMNLAIRVNTHECTPLFKSNRNFFAMSKSGI